MEVLKMLEWWQWVTIICFAVAFVCFAIGGGLIRFGKKEDGDV